MNGDNLLSLMIFGAGMGESILLKIQNCGKSPQVVIIDTYANNPYDSPSNNPILAIQSEVFEWDQVEAICLTHAHEDHFTGLAAVAKRTCNAKWVWPGGIPIDSIVAYYDELGKFKQAAKSKPQTIKWFTEKIRNIADWSKCQKSAFGNAGNQLLSSLNPAVNISFIAPTAKTSNQYTRLLMKELGNNLSDNYESVPHDFHNLPSSGMVIDTQVGTRIMLLGDMVRESWEAILGDEDLMALLSRKKVDILKVPHHCSNGAIWVDLLELICDFNKTLAVFTPFRLKSPPPHNEAIALLKDHVKELWCTVTLPKAMELRKQSHKNLIVDLTLRKFLENPQKCGLPPKDCMVAFHVDKLGDITLLPGKYALCLKGPQSLC